MFRRLAHKNLKIALSLALALGVAATRTEKLWAEMQADLFHDGETTISASGHGLPEPFDPARVPQSGGMASRLLAGISVKLSA